jgi:hypothetical protein
MRPVCMLSVLTLAVLGVPLAAAQSTLDHPVGEYVEYWVDTQALDNQTTEPAVVASQIVAVEDAAWLRLFFEEVSLEGSSLVRVTSLEDGEFQELDAQRMAEWGNSTVYFNGSEVLLEVIADAGTSGNRVVLNRVEVEFPTLSETGWSCGICQNDDRELSNEDFACRIMSVGCSGTVFTTKGCLVSAGHCDGPNLVAQFRVPPSTSNCTLRHPPADDQFRISARRARNGGVGADWAVWTTLTNGQGQTCFQRYGTLRRIADVPANVGDADRVNGYGVDQRCERTQVQQLSLGNISRRAGTWYESLNTDITYGNSGSSLRVRERIVGIVTHCTQDCPDYMTRHDNADFVAARNEICPPCADLNGDGTVGQADLAILLASFGLCVGENGYVDAADLNGDGCVNQADLATLLASFGTNC